MELLIKCIAFAFVTALTVTLIKRYVPEISVTVTLVACGVIFALSSEAVRTALSFINKLAEAAGVDNALLMPVIKVSAVALLARIGSEVCKENGILSVATLVELSATVVAIVLSLPLLEAALELIVRM